MDKIELLKRLHEIEFLISLDAITIPIGMSIYINKAQEQLKELQQELRENYVGKES